MKRKQISDEALSSLLTEAYDAHLDAVEVRDPAEAFPSGGRWREAPDEGAFSTSVISSEAVPPRKGEHRSSENKPRASADKQGLSLQAQQQAGGEPEAPVAIRSTSTKRARWQGAVAAILVMTVLGAGGWLLHRQLTRKTAEAAPADPGYASYQGPTPKNCHAELKNGETVWVLDADYDGTYDLQKASTRFVGDVITEDWPLPGFEQQTVMSYADYAAYCKQWGLTQTYTDPEQNYLVYAWGGFQNDPADSPRLTDVVWTDDAVTVFLCKPELKQGYNEACVRYPAPWVLTVPVGQKTGTVKVQLVLAPEAPAPKHCHPADLGGETIWVLEDEDARYEGEYDLQSLTEKNPEINWSRDEEREGFEQQTLMSYAEYAAYCEKWGMDQKYRDPDQRYLVWAKWYPNNFGEDLRLIDVTWDAQTAYLYFWNQDEPQVKLTTYWANPGRAWVLVLPTTLEITSLETRRVMSEKTYHWKNLDLTLWEKNKMETLPDGSIRIIGWAERAEPFGHVPPKAFILRFGDETICIWTENTPMWDPEGEPFEDFFDISNEPTGGGLPYRYLFVRAEGCQRIEDRGLNGEPDEYPDYRADWLFLSCNVDPEAAFAAVNVNGSGEQETNPVFTETENGNYLSPWGEEYALLANEGILDCIGTETFVGKVSGEGEGPAWKAAYGFYALDEDEARNILIRVSSSEWYGIYRKVSSPPFDFSVDNCVRLELVKNSWLLKNNTEHLTCGDGITDPAEIAAFLADVRSQKSPEEAGLYDLVRKENGFLENCYQYGVIYGFFSEEPNLAVPLTVTSYNDMAYSVSIEQKEYVLPEKWVNLLTAGKEDTEVTAFQAISLTEILDRANNPGKYAQTVHDLFYGTLIDYGEGTICLFLDGWGRNAVYGAYVFDREHQLRQKYGSQLPTMPNTGQLAEETLGKRTIRQFRTKYGKEIMDTGSGLYIPVWLTDDGRMIVLSGSGLNDLINGFTVIDIFTGTQYDVTEKGIEEWAPPAEEDPSVE